MSSALRALPALEAAAMRVSSLMIVRVSVVFLSPPVRACLLKKSSLFLRLYKNSMMCE
jgi:hypothetical protein